MLSLTPSNAFLIYNILIGLLALALITLGFVLLRRLLRWLDHKE